MTLPAAPTLTGLLYWALVQWHPLKRARLLAAMKWGGTVSCPMLARTTEGVPFDITPRVLTCGLINAIIVLICDGAVGFCGVCGLKLYLGLGLLLGFIHLPLLHPTTSTPLNILQGAKSRLINGVYSYCTWSQNGLCISAAIDDGQGQFII